MSPQKLHAQSHADGVVQYGILAAHALTEVADVENVPYLQAVAGISLLIMETVQSVRTNKSQCMRLVAQIHEILCVLVNLCGNFEPNLSLAILRSIAQFTETLQKIHAYIRGQVDQSLLKRIVGQAQNSAQLDECKSELRQALGAFGSEATLVASRAMAQIQIDAARRHEELMDFVNAQIDFQSLRSSHSSNNLRRSSSTLSLIPASPKIFYGREKEVKSIIASLNAPNPARIAILGSGGMGKSSLALTVMHDPVIVSAFGPHRFFISLYSACSVTDMIGRIARYFGLEQEGKPHNAVLRYLCAISAPFLFVLDNLEDCWEPVAGRQKVEEFISLLADIPDLHLMITMRGAERPSKVKWTRPFLAPLLSLDSNAARSAFLDITDDVSDEKLMNKLLALTDHLPLAISLMANLVSLEGCESVLDRWNSHTTSLLSYGPDKVSNLDKSIMVSISSARMTSTPNALRLLSILSLLPDGVSSIDLENMGLPLPDLLRCTSMLLRCSLSYLDADNRFKVLTPIREHVRKYCPLSDALRDPVRTHFYSLCDLFRGPEFMSYSLIQRIASDLGNIRAVCLYSVNNDREHLADTVRCIIKIAGFTYTTTLGSLEGLDSVSDVVATLGNPQLHGQYLHIMGQFNISTMLEPYSRQAIQSFEKVNDLTGQAKSYRSLGLYYESIRNTAKAFEVLTTSIALAEQAGDLSNQASSMVDLSQHFNLIGNTTLALRHAREAEKIARASGNLYIEARAIRAHATTCERIGDYARGARLCVEAKRLLSALSASGNRVSVFRHIVNTEAEISLQQTNYTLARALNLSLTSPEESQTGFSHQEISNGYALINIAFIDIATGNHSTVTDTLNLAQSLFTAHRSRFGLAACDITLGDLHSKCGEYAEAQRLYRAAFTSIPSPEIQTMCLEKLADVALALHDVVQASYHTTLLLILACKSGYQATIHRALRRLGDVFHEQGDDTSGATLFEVSLAGFTLMDIHKERGNCLVRLGDIHEARGDASTARALWESARPLFEKSSQREDVAACDRRLGVTTGPSA